VMPHLAVVALQLVAGDAGAEVVHEEVITASRVDHATERVAVDDVVGGGTMLLAVPGVGLARDGGPLSPQRPVVRGLGGPRLAVDVDGLGFADPASGEVDVALLPLALGTAVVDVAGVRAPAASSGLGPAVSLRPASGSRLQLVAGDLATLQGSLRLVTPVDGGRVVTAVSGGTSRGNYPFVAIDADGDIGASLVRAHNDHRRLNAAVVADVSGPSPIGSGQLLGHMVFAGAWHEGGIPGFATAPLVSLRGEQVRGAFGAGVSFREGHRRIGLHADSVGDRRRTTSDERNDMVATLGSGVGLVVGDSLAVGGAVLDVELEARAGGASVWQLAWRSEARGVGRLGAALAMAPDLFLDVQGELGMGVVDDTDLGVRATSATSFIPRGSLAASIRRRHGEASVGLIVRHRARAPSLDERFAPAGFIRGTPDLRPERVSDVEVRGHVAKVGAPSVDVDVAAFFSQLDDAIVLVNKNAFEVAPENTGLAHRAGVELGLVARPVPLVVVRQAATLLWSVVEATGAPLPTAPPLGLRTDVQLGDDDAFVGATVTGRGSAPSTIFGTLGSGAFVLVDLRARLPIASTLAATLHVDNALDVRTARDQNLLPLPGRLAFVGLEVRL
jgi:hypothetical protein